MSIFLREIQLGCGRSLVSRLIAILIVVPLICVLICFPLWLVTQFDQSIWVLILPASLFLLILIGGGIGMLGIAYHRRARELDALFSPLGLKGSLYQMYFRQYHGRLDGRDVAVYFYRGPTLEIEVETFLQTRLVVTGRDAENTFLAQLLGREPLKLDGERLGDLMVFSLDEKWARRMLSEGDVPETLQRLIGFEGDFLRRQLILQPGLLRLRLHSSGSLFGHEVGQAQAEGWVRDLLALVQVLEGKPGPEVMEEGTAAEQMARSMRQRNPYTLPAITILVALGSVCCALVVGVVAFLWAVAQ